MARHRTSLRRSILLTTLILLSLFSAIALAQDNKGGDTKTPDATKTDDPKNTTPPAPTETKANDDDKKPTATSTDDKDKKTTSKDDDKKTTSKDDDKKTTTTDDKDKKTTDPASPTSSDLPRLPTSESTTGGDESFPTLSSTSDSGSIPTYPAPAVPNTQHAPFMRQSSAPEGTVFIAVGAILGAFGAAILLWRGIIACLLHRSVERAALAQHVANDKAAFPAPPAPFYKYTDRDSSPHLAGPPVRGQRRTNRGPILSATPSQTNLFFSPTAGGGGGAGGGGMGTPGDRSSRFLPSGFYAAGSGTPGAQHGSSISMSNLRPVSAGASRALDPSPPDSPAFNARNTPIPRASPSTSTLNLGRPSSQRAPSAYLDDLLDEQPHLFPPGGPGPDSPGRS